ncbi:MAG: hypothetical protein EHM58_03775 [Ignavibacteriae bacterium]|nr:MAG: hypothetical protein EHM58_03775 [Ignavibacteriota bacterium]
MFIGHFGAGLAGKKPAPQVSLGTLFLASQWLDLLWPLLLLFGIEHVVINPGDTIMTPLNFSDYPYSHSLIFVLAWSIIIGGIYFFIKRNVKNSLIVGLLVLSHWVLDLFVHRPDLPLLTSGPNVGFGLWNSPVIAIILESVIFILGVWFYISATSAKDKIGTYAFWALIVFLVIIYFGNIMGPPPPDVKSIAYLGLTQWLLVLWAYWVDRHRVAAGYRLKG